ncbi:Ig-like domain-containing protein [Aeromicrobium sp. HA]|uniref:Ig-like domain-containing protein n=1 Tax=Aeromicrobium sp. HA TaxID=3009077 RepID=UPI0022AFC35C|nr:Ig-like domain-containing protein [Aeromicrobium sp. HA]
MDQNTQSGESMRTSPARRSLGLLAVLALLSVAALVAPGFSSAAFTSTTDSTATVTASPDWTPPTVTVTSPGTAVQGTVTVAAEASDSGLGVKDVTLEYSVVGSGTWTAMCTDTTAPYSCAWNTAALADGRYDLRARATDLAGYETTSDAVRTAVANKLLVVMNDPGDTVRGTVQLSAAAFNTGTLSHTVRIQYRLAGASTWSTACSNLAAPYTCSWSSAAVTSGDYEFRAVLTAGTTTTTSEIVTDVTVDNVAPTVTMTDPGSPLSGTRTFAATAADAHSGVATVEIQYAASGTSTWKSLCTVEAEPWSCRAATNDLANGAYSFRAIATDEAGNATMSAAVANRVVDNTVSSVSLNDPGVLLSRTATLSAVASSTAGVTSVRIQYAPTGGSTWTDVCTDTTSPYSCTWDTTKVASAVYDLRAVLLDGSGRTTISALETVPVDNSPLAGADVQTTNGSGSIAGQPGANDTVTFTYTAQVNPASIMAGWNGTSTNVQVRLRDGNVPALLRGSKGDTLDVMNGSTVLGLGSVNLKGDYVRFLRTVSINATMTAGTVTVNGLERTVVTLKLGTFASGKAGDLKTSTTAAAMVWTPSSAATDLSGNRCSTTNVTETGTADKDF